MNISFCGSNPVSEGALARCAFSKSVCAFLRPKRGIGRSVSAFFNEMRKICPNEGGETHNEQIERPEDEGLDGVTVFMNNGLAVRNVIELIRAAPNLLFCSRNEQKQPERNA